MTSTPRDPGTWAGRAGQLVALLRRSGPGVGGPLLVIASVAAWDIRVAGLLAGLILWSYDVWTGLPPRQPGKDGDR